MIINHNLNAMNAHRNSGLNTSGAAKSMEKLSSGLRINRAADDAAGLSISEKMRGQIKGLNQAQRNAQDGISYIQTAEGALNEVSDMLTRMKELTVQNSNGTYNTDDKANLQLEMHELDEQISKIIDETKFNGLNVLKGDIKITVTDSDATSSQLTVGVKSTSLSSVTSLTSASTTANVEDAIKAVNTTRSTLGAQQNRLEYTSNNLGTTAENLTAAESRIRDTDMALEMTKLSSKNIIAQASQTMLAQANQNQQNVLSILR